LTDQESKEVSKALFQEKSLDVTQNNTQDSQKNEMLNSKSTAIETPKDKSKVLKTIQVFVESNIEFTIEIDDPKATCGWL